MRIEEKCSKFCWSRSMSIDREKPNELNINKSTLWYQQIKIKEGKTIKIYNKAMLMIEYQ